MDLRAILLDFDGLICDTERAARHSWTALFASHGLDFPDGLWRRMAGRHDGEELALARLADELGTPVPPEERERRRALKAELCRAEGLRPGVTALLDEAERRGVAAHVVSSSSADWVEPHLLRLGVRARFASLVTGDLVERRKPAPDLYLLALRRAGLSPREAYAFEDSPVGLGAARAAGLRCAVVPSAAAEGASLAGASAVLDSLDAFPFDQHTEGSHSR
ncbi:HAD family hydrolase [Streptomyces sp. NPDC014746]|uniref:HAD family hydrolase n=1 Tax=Streptomyces sp. NPDC014746 TaxID=3364904 RepID=UPI0036F536AF